MKYVYLLTLSLFIMVGCTTTNIKPTGKSNADALLKKDTTRELQQLETAFRLNGQKGIPIFGGIQVVHYAQVSFPKTATDGWEEIWTIQRKGYVVKYKIKFIPTPAIGGTDIQISPIFKVSDYQ